MENAKIKDQYLQWKEAQNTGKSEGSMLNPRTDVKVTLFIFHFKRQKKPDTPLMFQNMGVVHDYILTFVQAFFL